MASIPRVPIPPGTSEETATRQKEFRKALARLEKLAEKEPIFTDEYMKEKLANAICVPPPRKRKISADEKRAPRKRARKRDPR